MMDGGGNTFTDLTFNDISFPAEGISGDGLTAWNMNGTYQFSGGGTDQITITASPASCEGYTQGSVGTCTDATMDTDADIKASDLDWGS